MTTERKEDNIEMTIKTEEKNKKQNRDFERHKVYTTNNANIQYGQNKTDKYKNENKFKFKNSLVITPFYEIEFNATGGIKYIKNHENCVFFTDDSIFAITNNVQKIPVLLKRGITKQSVQKKLIVSEKYNYEEKYEIYKNIILYYEENRLDYQIQFNKLDSVSNPKDITTEFSLNLTVTGINEKDNTVIYKKFGDKQENKTLLSNLNSDLYSSDDSDSLEYIVINGKPGGVCATLYPEKNLLTKYKNKSLNFSASNFFQSPKVYINLKIYLENYRIT